MAFPNFAYLNNSSPGFPGNSGTNASFKNLMKWALLQVGWSNVDETTNGIVLRAATGNRFPFIINDDSAVTGNARFAMTRGAEIATGVTTFTDAFPTAVLLADANANAYKSSLASGTDRQCHIVAWDTGFIYASQFNGTDWEIFPYSDLFPSRSADTWATYIGPHGGTNTGQSSWFRQTEYSNINLSAFTTGYLARSYDGTVKSTKAALNLRSRGLGNTGTSGWPTASNGPDGEIDTSPVGIACSGSTGIIAANTGMVLRGYIPHMHNPLHNGIGGLSSGDIYHNSAYDPAADFLILKSDTTNFVALEITNTWKPPA